MRVKFSESQDIDVFLSRKDFEGLVAKLGRDFFGDNCIKVASKELKVYFFVGYALDSDNIFARAEKQNGILFKYPEEMGDPYYINLQDEAVRKLRLEGWVNMRYLGGSKLAIIIEE